jgi:multidrug efflux system outer membrane protein
VFRRRLRFLFSILAAQGKLDVSKIGKKIEIANYEKAIQTAFREVADALAVRSILDEKLKEQELLLIAQQKRFDLTNARYRQGVDSYVDVLLAQQDLYAAQQFLLQFQAARLLNARHPLSLARRRLEIVMCVAIRSRKRSVVIATRQ